MEVFLADKCRLWRPYKSLNSVVNDAIVRQDAEAQAQLEDVLKTHRKNFTALLDTEVWLFY